MADRPRLLALLGSGETAPTMVKVHRAILERVGAGPAVILDTPYGFQENASDISARAVEYFASSVGRAVEVAGLRNLGAADPVGREASLARVAAAGWLFAGPGSPTYALRQWEGSEIPGLIADKLANGGAVVFASAAAITLGRYSVPVYEIYKSGAEVKWAKGLDLLDVLGQDVAVIPHYDNAEGGHHDTRYCYLGETRLRLLEEQLPERGWVLGVDEHTGVVIDFDAATASVVGLGTMTIRRHGDSVVVASGETVPLDELAGMEVGKGAADGPEGTSGACAAVSARRDEPTPLHAEIRRAQTAFDEAMACADIDAAVRAVLDLDQITAAWAGDTTQSDVTDRARAALRRMVVRIGQLATLGARDPRQVVGPYVDALLSERAVARSNRRFHDADRVRDRLAAAGVEVRDTPEGTEWSFRPLV